MPRSAPPPTTPTDRVSSSVQSDSNISLTLYLKQLFDKIAGLLYNNHHVIKKITVRTVGKAAVRTISLEYGLVMKEVNRMGRGKTILWPFFVVLLLAGALTAEVGCGQKKTTVELPPVAVTLARVRIQDVPLQIETFGNVEAYSQIPVKTMISGQIKRFAIKPGDYVKKGEVLLEIDKRPYEAVLRQLEATLNKDTILFTDYLRQAEMKERLLATGSMAINEAKTIRAQTESQRALIQADKAAIEKARLDLEYCTITAPIDGRAGDILIYEGTVVKANDLTILNLVQLKPIYVTFAVPQIHLPTIREFFQHGKLMVHAKVPVQDGVEGDGELTFIDNTVSAVSGTVKLKASFPNGDLKLWPGQYVNVVLRLATEKNCLVVPSQAVQSGQEGSYVFVVKPNNEAEFRPVQPGRSVNGMTIVLSGLKDREKVVTDGHIRLFPGAKVFEPDHKIIAAATK